MKKPVKMNFIANAERFLKKNLSERKLIMNKLSPEGKLVYYGSLCTFCLVIFVPCWLVNFFNLSYYFLSLLLLLIPILFFSSRKTYSEKKKTLDQYKNTELGFESVFGNFNDDFGELKYLFLANHVEMNHLTLPEFESFYIDFTENHPVKPYKWWYSKIIVLPLLAWVASSGAAYFLGNELLKTNKENFISIIQICLYIIITVPFMEFNLFKLRADNKNSDNLRDKRFLQAFKSRYFGDNKTNA